MHLTAMKKLRQSLLQQEYTCPCRNHLSSFKQVSLLVQTMHQWVAWRQFCKF